MKIGFWLETFPKKKTQKDSYTNPEIQGWRGYGEISVWSHSQDEKLEKGNENSRSKGLRWNFCCKVMWFWILRTIFYTQLTMNKDDNNFY